MKKSLIIGLLALTGASLTSCDHLLNENRFPLDQQRDNPEFWNNSRNVEQEINYFYLNWSGYGTGAGRNGSFYFQSLSDDQCNVYGSSATDFTEWKFRQAAESNSTWSASYEEIRRANMIMERVAASTLLTSEKDNYIAQCRLYRAIQYYELVRAFGDVPLVKQVLLPTDDEEIYGPRVSRNEVMDFALEDLNFACEKIAKQSGKLVFSKDFANAYKSEICLFEGSYAKYHQKDQTRANKYFGEVVKACENIMNSGYTLCEDYQSLYNSFFDGENALPKNPEVIFMKAYIQGKLGNSIVKYTSTTVPIMGMTRDAFESYLFKDGKPLALTTCNKNDAGKMAKQGKDDIVDITEVLAERDQRLAKTIDPFVCYTGTPGKRANSDYISSTTGYSIKKFVNPAMTFSQATTDGQNATQAPIYWLARTYLDFAEAKAEMGTLTDADLNNTINKLYKRAGLPDQTVASLSSMNDPANNMGVSSLLWEIRRCRRCELMFDAGIRYWDLIRWHQLEILDTNNYPKTAQGANLKDVPANFKKKMFCTPEGYINVAQTANGTFQRVFNEREYLYPIPTKQITIYWERMGIRLEQNPGW